MPAGVVGKDQYQAYNEDSAHFLICFDEWKRIGVIAGLAPALYDNLLVNGSERQVYSWISDAFSRRKPV